VTELPIIVETSVWLSLTFGIILILASLLVARGGVSTLQSEAAPSVPSIVGLGVVALVAFGLGASLALQNVGWQFRLDDKGVALRAPFDYMHPGGEIAWSEIASVSVVAGGNRGPSFKLRFVSKGGTEIAVGTADRLPVQFGPLLQKLVTERAPQAKYGAEIAAQIANAQAEMGLNIAAGYWARNGRGELLR
jgi:hypothetical protein